MGSTSGCAAFATLLARPILSQEFDVSVSAIPVTPHPSAMASVRCVHTGPGYRIYYKQTGQTIVLLLCGGDKASQTKDIKRAKQLAAEF